MPGLGQCEFAAVCEAWAALRQGRTELIKQRGTMVAADADPDAVAFLDLIAENGSGGRKSPRRRPPS